MSDEREQHEEPGPDESGPRGRREDGDGAARGEPAARELDGKPPFYKRPPIVAALAVLLIAASVAGVLYWRHSRRYESTDDAYIDVISERVSPQVAGRVTRVLVDDNQDVRAGDLLVEIDPAEYRSRLDQAVASEAQARGRLLQARAQEAVLSAQLEQARANVGVAEANAQNAAADLERWRGLERENSGAASKQQLDNAAAAAKSTAAQLEVARRAVAAAEAQVGAARSEIAAAEATVQSAQAAVELARLDLSYTEIRARVDGRVARRSVAPGNWIQPGSELMAVVPADVWITANFKETQLQRIRARQDVAVKVDAYPDLELEGEVDSVQPATGQAFSVLPAENATGNWVKIVQRVPVKVVLRRRPRDPARRLGPGMSVEVKVRVR